MIRETYKGRKLKVTRAKDGLGRVGSINGHPMPTSFDPEEAILGQLRRNVDFVDQAPVDGSRWGAYMYAPGTYELCGEGLHPKGLGEPCLHPSCQAAAAQGG